MTDRELGIKIRQFFEALERSRFQGVELWSSADGSPVSEEAKEELRLQPLDDLGCLGREIISEVVLCTEITP